MVQPEGSLFLSHLRSQGAGSVAWHGGLTVALHPRIPSSHFAILSSEPRHLHVQYGAWVSVSLLCRLEAKKKQGNGQGRAHISAGTLPLSGLPDVPQAGLLP